MCIDRPKGSDQCRYTSPKECSFWFFSLRSQFQIWPKCIKHTPPVRVVQCAEWREPSVDAVRVWRISAVKQATYFVRSPNCRRLGDRHARDEISLPQFPLRCPRSSSSLRARQVSHFFTSTNHKELPFQCV